MSKSCCMKRDWSCRARAEAKVLQAVQLGRFDHGGRLRARGLAQELSSEHEDLRGERDETVASFWGKVDP